MHTNSLTKTAKTTLVIVFIVLLVFFFIYSFKVLLLILGGALIALFFDGITDSIQKRLPKIRKKILTGFTIISFLSFFGVLTYLLYPRIAEQILILKNDLPEAVISLKKTVKSNEALNYILESVDKSFKNKGVSGNFQRFFNSIFGFLGDFYIIITLGLFFLIQPAIYKKGFTKLFPLDKRKDVLKIIDSIGITLKRWLLGKMFSMLIVGVLTGIGLYVLNIPLALSLAIIATFSAFIPNIGPIIALIPALLIAFVKGQEYVLYVFVLYTVIQILESNVITPIIQREVISFPMALILIAQVVLGLFTGYLGLILATPVMAILLYLIKSIYVEKYLENQ